MAFFKVASTRADPEVRLAGHPWSTQTHEYTWKALSDRPLFQPRYEPDISPVHALTTTLLRAAHSPHFLRRRLWDQRRQRRRECGEPVCEAAGGHHWWGGITRPRDGDTRKAAQEAPHSLRWTPRMDPAREDQDDRTSQGQEQDQAQEEMEPGLTLSNDN